MNKIGSCYPTTLVGHGPLIISGITNAVGHRPPTLSSSDNFLGDIYRRKNMKKLVEEGR